MPRPRLPDNRRRSQRIPVRLSQADLDWIDEKRSPEQSISDYIRSRALSTNRLKPMVPEINLTVLDLIREHGHRINSLTHAAHQGQPVIISEADLKELARLLRFVIHRLA